MPRTKNTKASTVSEKKKIIRKSSPPDPVLKSEDTALELPLQAPSGHAFQRLLDIHIDELNRIWPNDRRIPTPNSRRAWAEARNLNLANVNSWWYRRKKIAKKLKISIPKDSYDLGVGVPPVIPMEVIVVEDDEDLEPTCVGFSTDLGTSSDADVTAAIPSLDANAATCLSVDDTDLSKSSPLPPSSPPRSSSPLALTWVNPDDSLAHAGSEIEDLDAEATATPFSFLELFYPAHIFPYRTFDLSISPCGSTPVLRFPTLFASDSSKAGDTTFTSESVNGASTGAPWCLNGFRLAYDGSFLGLCSSCSVDALISRIR